MRHSRPLVALVLAVSLAGIASHAAAAPPSPERLSAPPPASSLIGEGFAFLGEEKGVKVYRREKRPGIELAAEGKIGGAPERVRRVLVDYPSHPRWQKHLKENRVLAFGEGSLDVYQRLSLPVLDDRDFTLHVTWGSDADVLWTHFLIANERGPAPVSGVVRVTQQEGGWRLEPADGGSATHAVYRCYIDLAGSFPAWMGKGQATSDLPDLFASITAQLPGYR
ncbi:MAG: hypothetical protein ABJE95_30145 [Byssovorax sp.]